MNFNTSPIAFYPSRAAQAWRAWFAQRKVSVICGNDILPFYIIDSGSAPAAGELYEPNTDVKVADITLSPYLIDHDISVDGVSRHIWIYQGGTSGVFGYTTAGYYYLKVGSWYSDVFCIGALPNEYTEVSWQFYDDIITADGTPISKHIKYKQIFDVPIWHPSYGVEEEGKTNNGIFFAMQQTTKKTSGFSTIVNEAQVDCLNLTRMADVITIKSCINGVTKTMQTNQFEITSKWESDDIASIDCQFDLFSIIRKYQQSNVEPEPLPIPVPPPPPSLKKITGSLSENIASITVLYNNSHITIPCANKEFEWGFDDEPVGTLEFETNKDKITSLDLSNAGTLNGVTRMRFKNMPALTNVNFAGVEYKGLTTTNAMFEGTNITNVSLPDATFESVTDANGMFYNANCSQISMPNATFEAVTDASDMFSTALSNEFTINMPNATFALATTTSGMFTGCNVTKITMPNATFANVTTFSSMFYGGHGNLDFGSTFSSCTAQPTTASRMFCRFDGSVDITDLDCSLITDASYMFELCKATGANSIKVPASLGNIVDGEGMFQSCQGIAAFSALDDMGALSSLTNASFMFSKITGNTNQSVSASAAIFANVTNVEYMFQAVEVGSISLQNATFASVTNANHMVYNSPNLKTFSTPSCTFASLSYVQNNSPYEYCNNMTSITLASGDNMGLASGANEFVFTLLLPNISAVSVISILGNGKVKSSGTPNVLKIMTSRWNSYSQSDRDAINAAKKSGWSIVTVS